MKTRIDERVKSLVKEASVRWIFFQKGERILVGVTGSKESLALLQILAEFELQITAIFVNPSKERNSLLEKWCRSYGDYVEIDYQMNQGSSTPEGFRNICKRKERRTILEYAQKHDISTIACAQYRDQIVENLLVNMLFNHKIISYLPVEELYGGKYRIVRPFYLVPQDMMESILLKADYEPFTDSCCYDSGSQLEEMREMLASLQKKNPEVDFADNLLTSLL